MLVAGTWVYGGMYVPCMDVFAGIYWRKTITVKTIPILKKSAKKFTLGENMMSFLFTKKMDYYYELLY